MKIRKWQIRSIVIVAVMVCLISIFAEDNSIRGIYDGNSRSDAISEFPPMTGFLYSVQQVGPTQYSVEISSLAPFIFGLFWALFDAFLVLILGPLPSFFARPHGWPRVRVGILLSLLLVPPLLYVSLSLLSGSETFRMFTDFGIHRSGFGLDFSSAYTDMLRVPFWTVLLAVPNLILLITCIVKGGRGSLIRVLSLKGKATLVRA